MSQSPATPTQWPFLATDQRPYFYNPESGTQSAPVYPRPKVSAKPRSRNRRHVSHDARIQKPTTKKHPIERVRYYDHAHNARISNFGDIFVEWAYQRIKHNAPRYLRHACWAINTPFRLLNAELREYFNGEDIRAGKRRLMNRGREPRVEEVGDERTEMVEVRPGIPRASVGSGASVTVVDDDEAVLPTDFIIIDDEKDPAKSQKGSSDSDSEPDNYDCRQRPSAPDILPSYLLPARVPFSTASNRTRQARKTRKLTGPLSPTAVLPETPIRRIRTTS